MDVFAKLERWEAKYGDAEGQPKRRLSRSKSKTSSCGVPLPNLKTPASSRPSSRHDPSVSASRGKGVVGAGAITRSGRKPRGGIRVDVPSGRSDDDCHSDGMSQSPHASERRDVPLSPRTPGGRLKDEPYTLPPVRPNGDTGGGDRSRARDVRGVPTPKPRRESLTRDWQKTKPSHPGREPSVGKGRESTSPDQHKRTDDEVTKMTAGEASQNVAEGRENAPSPQVTTASKPRGSVRFSADETESEARGAAESTAKVENAPERRSPLPVDAKPGKSTLRKKPTRKTFGSMGPPPSHMDREERIAAQKEKNVSFHHSSKDSASPGSASKRKQKKKKTKKQQQQQQVPSDHPDVGRGDSGATPTVEKESIVVTEMRQALIAEERRLSRKHARGHFSSRYRPPGPTVVGGGRGIFAYADDTSAARADTSAKLDAMLDSGSLPSHPGIDRSRASVLPRLNLGSSGLGQRPSASSPQHRRGSGSRGHGQRPSDVGRKTPPPKSYGTDSEQRQTELTKHGVGPYTSKKSVERKEGLVVVVMPPVRDQEKVELERPREEILPAIGKEPKKKKGFSRREKEELRSEFRSASKKVIVNLRGGDAVEVADKRKGLQRDTSRKDGGMRSTFTAARRKHFQDARDNLYGISETGDEALKRGFKNSILEMRYNRDFFIPEDRSRDKNQRIEVEKELEEEIAKMRNRKDYFAFTREVEFGAVWGKACFELGDMLMEGKPGHEELKAAVEEVLKRYFVQIKETFRLYSMSASEMVGADGVRHQDSSANTMGPSEFMRFVQESRITGKKLPMSHCHLIFLRANQGHRLAMKKLNARAPLAAAAMQAQSKKDEKWNPDDELVLHEFIGVVVRLAHARLTEPADDPLPRRIERIMENYIMPNCGQGEETGNAWHRARMAEEPLNDIYLRKEKALRFVFEGYASLDGSDRGHAKDLNITEFLRLIYDAKLLDSEVTPGGMAGDAVKKKQSGGSLGSDAMVALSAAKLKLRQDREGAAAAGAAIRTDIAKMLSPMKQRRKSQSEGDGDTGFDIESKVYDGLTLHEIIEIFVRSQIEGAGEGMVQMDYDEFEESLLRIARKMTIEPRVCVARKAAKALETAASGTRCDSKSQNELDPTGDDLDVVDGAGGAVSEGGSNENAERTFEELEDDERLLAVIEAVLSCRPIVVKWNDERAHREKLSRMSKEKSAGAELTKGATTAMALLGGAGAKIKAVSSKF